MAQESKTPAPFRTSIGGQALIEGILMRGVDRQAIVCRKSDGTLVSRVDPLKLSKDKHPWMGYPFIRGVVNFLDSMVNGVKAITWSAEQQPEDEQGEPDKFDLWIQKHFSDETAEKIILYTAVVLGIALSVGLFALLPTFLAGLLNRLVPLGVWRGLAEGIFRLAIFLGYLKLCSMIPDMKRVWMYHGAEHKTIFCYEAAFLFSPSCAPKERSRAWACICCFCRSSFRSAMRSSSGQAGATARLPASPPRRARPCSI